MPPPAHPALRPLSPLAAARPRPPRPPRPPPAPCCRGPVPAHPARTARVYIRPTRRPSPPPPRAPASTTRRACCARSPTFSSRRRGLARPRQPRPPGPAAGTAPPCRRPTPCCSQRRRRPPCRRWSPRRRGRAAARCPPRSPPAAWRAAQTSSAPIELHRQPAADHAVEEAITDSDEYMAAGQLFAATDACFEVIRLAPDFLPDPPAAGRDLRLRGRPEDAAAKLQSVIDLYLARGESDLAAQVYPRWSTPARPMSTCGPSSRRCCWTWAKRDGSRGAIPEPGRYALQHRPA